MSVNLVWHFYGALSNIVMFRRNPRGEFPACIKREEKRKSRTGSACANHRSMLFVTEGTPIALLLSQTTASQNPLTDLFFLFHKALL